MDWIATHTHTRTHTATAAAESRQLPLLTLISIFAYFAQLRALEVASKVALYILSSYILMYILSGRQQFLVALSCQISSLYSI